MSDKHDSHQHTDEELAEAQVSIAEKVRFWEEQDKLNQEIIPRLIRQHRLLSEHIKNHESLPDIADRAVRQALAESRVEQKRQYEAIVQNLSAAFRDSVRRLLAEERGEQQAKYEAALASIDRRWHDDSQLHRTRLHRSLVAIGIIFAVLILAALVLASLALFFP